MEEEARNPMEVKANEGGLINMELEETMIGKCLACFN